MTRTPTQTFRLAIQATLLSIVLFTVLFALPILAASDHQRVHLLPQFKPGDSLRYQIDSQMTVAGTTTTPIVNPEGATELKQSISIILRLDVLEVHPAAPTTPGKNNAKAVPRTPTASPAPATNAAAPGTMRLRATYEKSSATSESDAYDPTTAALADQYNRLEGRSMEFTVEPDGKIVDIKGLEDMLSNPSAAQTVRTWMAGLSSSAGFPQQGIEIGQKWSREQPLTGVPLDHLFWRTEATYLRNEICPENIPPADSAATAPAQIPEPTSKAPTANSPLCAIILTQFTIVRRGTHNPHADDTPDDYLHNGLRTSGTWTGSGESLDTFSLATGRMLRSTQSSSQDLDFSITSTNTGSRLTYKGKITTQTQILLLP